MDRQQLKDLIRAIPDWPHPGIMFRDVTTLFKDPEGFQYCLDYFKMRYLRAGIDVVAGIEARGFILGAPLAYLLGAGFVPVRKKNKLPGDKISESYQLEYGQDTIEMHVGAILPGQKVLLMDDLIATGGTALAAAALVARAGGEIVEASFVVDLPELGGRQRLDAQGIASYALVDFPGV